MAPYTKDTLKLNHGQNDYIKSPCFKDTITPTVEEWEYLTADEPELTYFKDQIRKKGFISEEI